MSIWQRLFGRGNNTAEQARKYAAPTTYPSLPPPMFSQIGRPAPRGMVQWPEFLSSGLTPTRLAQITRQADQGYLRDQMGLLQEIAGRDGLIQGLLTTRLSALSRKEVRVEPSKADNDAVRAAEVAAYGEMILQGLRLIDCQIDGSYLQTGGLASIVEALTIPTYYGAGLSWVHWDTPSGENIPRPCYVEKLDERRLGFDIETQTLHLATTEDMSPGVPVTVFDPALYMQVRNTRVSQRLSQCGSGRAILIPFSLRLGSLKDLLTYAEVWALPGIIGKMSSEVSAAFSADSVSAFQSMIEDFAGDSRQILPPGFDVEILSAVSGGEKVFELIDSVTERQIQFAIVGNVGTASGDKATYASAEVGMQVQSTLTDGDARMVSEALEGLLKHAVALRFGKGTPTPDVVFRSPVATQSANERAELYAKAIPALLSMIEKGVAVDIQEYAKIFDIPLRKENANADSAI